MPLLCMSLAYQNTIVNFLSLFTIVDNYNFLLKLDTLPNYSFHDAGTSYKLVCKPHFILVTKLSNKMQYTKCTAYTHLYIMYIS